MSNKKSVYRKKTFDIDKVLDKFVVVLMVIMIIGAVYPLIYVVSVSFSSGLAVDRGEVFLWPVDFTVEAYRYLFDDASFIIAFANSMFYMLAGTVYLTLISTMVAYVLSRKHFILNKALNLFILCTMWLSAGTIPMYLNFKMLGFYDSRIAMVVGFGLSAFNIILIRNYFDGLPKELIEAAKVDGATETQILSKVYIPLSKPILATVGLFYALGRWNTWFWHSLLIKSESKIPLQVLLRRLLIQSSESVEDTANEIVQIAAGQSSYTTIQHAVMVFSIVPVIIVYPYVQKHFTKGITMGGVKS